MHLTLCLDYRSYPLTARPYPVLTSPDDLASNSTTPDSSYTLATHTFLGSTQLVSDPADECLHYRLAASGRIFQRL